MKISFPSAALLGAARLPPPRRGLLVLAHRYVGLVLAGFLLLAGLTGSLLAWYDELEAWAAPELFLVEAPAGARPLDALVLRRHLLAHFPALQLPYAALHIEPGRAMVYSIKRRPPPTGGSAMDDQAFINPYTGALLGTRKWGELSQGRKNIMPFIYRLHTTLALGVTGGYVFGVVSLLWTLDCIAGALLTLPPPVRKGAAKNWGRRWWPAWKVRWRGGAYKVHVDLHRAGGLWPWAMLLVLAWSGVAFNLKEVYAPVMEMFFAHQAQGENLPELAQPQPQPGLDWPVAREVARGLMAQQAGELGFTVEGEDSLVYEPGRALFIYDVRSSLDVTRVHGVTRIFFDANTGRYLGRWLPSGIAAGDTIRSWITLLHRAEIGGVLGGWPVRLLICVLGLSVSMLSVTGVVIWLRKRRGRRQAALNRVAV